jgi:membrane protease YdiL (CAAX protease family)
MWRFMVALRTAALVFGVAALATLINRLVANSGLREWLLLNQLSIPGALYTVEAVATFTYGAAALLVSYFVARSYWRDMFPEVLSWKLLIGCLAAGVLFAMFLNHPMHVFLFDVFFDKPQLAGGAVSDSMIGGIFSGLRPGDFKFSMPFLATTLVTPFIEELTDRGILFKECQPLAPWQRAVLSFMVFCLSHYAIGGMAKSLAVIPAALLFIAIRMWTGSFVYSASAHAGLNTAALMKLQVL